MSKKEFHGIYAGAIKANLIRQRTVNSKGLSSDDLNDIIRSSLDEHYNYLMEIAADQKIDKSWQDATYLHPWVDFSLSGPILLLMFSPSTCARSNSLDSRDNDTYKQVARNSGLEPNTIDVLHLSPPDKNLPVYNDDCKYLARLPYVQSYYKACLDMTIAIQRLITGSNCHVSAVYIGSKCASVAAVLITVDAVDMGSEILQYSSGGSDKALVYCGQHLSYHLMNQGKTLHLFAFYCDVIENLFRVITQSSSSDTSRIIRDYSVLLFDKQGEHIQMHADMIKKTTELFGAESVAGIKRNMPSIYHFNLKPSFDLMELLVDETKETRMTSLDTLRRLLSRSDVITKEEVVNLIQNSSFTCRSDALLDMIIENKLEAGQLIELYKRDSFCCRAEALTDMIVENKNLEAGQLIELYKRDSFCCRAEALIDMIVHRSHLVSLKAILIMFHSDTFSYRADDAIDMVIALSKYFTESMISSLLNPYHAKHLDMLIENYKPSLPALGELWKQSNV